METVCKTQVDISQGKFYLEENDMKILLPAKSMNLDRPIPTYEYSEIALDKKESEINKLLQRNLFVLYPN